MAASKFSIPSPGAAPSMMRTCARSSSCPADTIEVALAEVGLQRDERFRPARRKRCHRAGACSFRAAEPRSAHRDRTGGSTRSHRRRAPRESASRAEKRRRPGCRRAPRTGRARRPAACARSRRTQAARGASRDRSPAPARAAARRSAAPSGDGTKSASEASVSTIGGRFRPVLPASCCRISSRSAVISGSGSAPSTIDASVSGKNSAVGSQFSNSLWSVSCARTVSQTIQTRPAACFASSPQMSERAASTT